MTFAEIISGGRDSLIGGAVTHYLGRAGGRRACRLGLYWDGHTNRVRATVTYCWTEGQLVTEFSVEQVVNGQTVHDAKLGRFAIDYTPDLARSELISGPALEGGTEAEFREWDRRLTAHDAQVFKSLTPLPVLPSGYPFP